jgi:hypothetical protein
MSFGGESFLLAAMAGAQFREVRMSSLDSLGDGDIAATNCTAKRYELF